MSFRLTDPAAGTPVVAIPGVCDKIKAIIARAGVGAAWTEVQSAQYVGAYGIAAGIQYHFDNHQHHWAIVRPLFEANAQWAVQFGSGMAPIGQPPLLNPTPEQTVSRTACHHEAVAYLNRMAQYLKFAEACGHGALMPRSRQLKVLRNKHAAHRSVDDPHDEDPEEHVSFAIAFNMSMLVQNGNAAHQAFFDANLVEFTPAVDHATIMSEALAAVQAIFPNVA